MKYEKDFVLNLFYVVLQWENLRIIYKDLVLLENKSREKMDLLTLFCMGVRWPNENKNQLSTIIISLTLRSGGRMAVGEWLDNGLAETFK